jgi:hypothetical protein
MPKLPALRWSRKFLTLRNTLLALCAIGAILTGCVANLARRDRDSRPWRPDKPQTNFVQGPQLDQYEPFNSADATHRFDLSYIEFDEKGDFWDRRQLGWTVQEIKRAAKAKDIVLVVYVHGWQNDASDIRGHDVKKFHCLLEHLAEAEGDRRFFGVYIGWRGKSVPGGDGVFPDKSIPDLISRALFFVPHELSLYSRKAAATRVAGLPVTEAIFQSVAAARTAERSRTILIGHSFGALLLEKAMAQALAAKVISEDGTTGGKFTAPADFVVLLNSAAESIYAKEMIDMFRRRKPAHSSQDASEISAKRPLIVSITSTGDWATGILFPIGTGLSNVTGMFRKYEWDTLYGQSGHNVSQRNYFTQTPGHNDLLISYDAQPVKGLPKTPRYEDKEECSPEMLGALKRNLNNPPTDPNGRIRFATVASTGEETDWELQPRIPDDLQTPYWIIKVPKEIIRDHSDIFNENALAITARLFRLVTTREPRTMKLADPR